MKYKSTRNAQVITSFENAICSGYAPDGGLFVPQTLPSLSSFQIKEWSLLSFPELSYEVLRLFIATEEITNGDLREIVNKAFGGGSFVDGVVNVRRLSSSNDNDNDNEKEKANRNENVFVSELFGGPTFCFKDIGMRLVVNILSHFSSSTPTTLLVATTGDTGPAAVRAVSDAQNPNLSILVHYPKGQISDFQRKQLTTVCSDSVEVVTFEGGGDDMDLPIKNILALSSSSSSSSSFDVVESKKKTTSRRRRLCGVNSYNIGRPLAQMIHFIWTYLRVVEQIGVESSNPDITIDIVIPTGAMGNIAGGYMAKQMGLPINYLCAGVNVNDIIHRVLETGKFYKSNEMIKTMSDAINVQMPYNFERLLFYLTGQNHVLVNGWMKTVDSTNKLDLDKTWHEKLRQEFRSARITDEEMCNAMKRARDELSFFADPHTSVALSAAEKLGYRLFQPLGDEEESSIGTAPVVAIMATASPCKFEETVTVALGKDGWDDYFEKSFPENAKDLLDTEEMPPTLYRWDKDMALDDVQKVWEHHSRDIIRTKFDCQVG